MNESAWAQFLVDQGVLKFGDFQLKDGSRSPFFLDFGALATGSSFRELGEFFAGLIVEKVGLDAIDFLYGPPYKATMLAGATAMMWPEGDIPCLFTRKEAKKHGEGGTSFGYQPQPGERYVLIDDVMSSGGTKLEALENLSGSQCVAVVVGVDREHLEGSSTAAQLFTEKTGVPVYSLIGLGRLCQALEGKIESGRHQAMKEFCGA